MWKFIDRKILQINKVTGMEIIIMPDDNLFIHTSVCSNQKNKIVQENYTSWTTEPEKLIKKINNGIPLSVVLNGKGVLTRKIPETYSKDNPLAAVLPGTNPGDFYYEIFQNANFTAINVIRKQTVDSILTRLKECGFTILSVSFAFNSLPPVLAYLESGDEKEINAGSFIIKLDRENQILDFKPGNETANNQAVQPEYLIAGQYVKTSQLLSFAASVNLLADDIKNPVTISSELLLKQRKDYTYYKYFRFASMALLTTLFIVLLSSFLIYNHYFRLNNEMQTVQTANDLQNKRIHKTEQDIRQKEKFLSRSGWISHSKASYYADRIAGLTPGDILLTTMNLYPLKTDLSAEGGSVTYKKDTIEVSGICYDPVVLNQFINGLKIINDFSKVTVKNYQYRKENEAGAFLMEIITR